MKELAHRTLMLLVRALSSLGGRRTRAGEKRSLWVGDPILTLSVNAAAERLNGIEADSLVFATYHVTEDFTYQLGHLTGIPLVGKLVRYGVLVWALHRYQRFHFFFNRGILPQLEPGFFNPDELELLQSRGKQMYFWAFGGDVRTESATRRLGRWNCCSECPDPGQRCVCHDDKAAANLGLIARCATGMFAMGDMIHYVPGARTDLFYWPVPIEAGGGQRYRPRYPEVEVRGPLRIAHAPNERSFKGTRFLCQAIEQLQGEGVPVQLDLVEGRPNAEVLELFRNADVVFDQCLVGFHGYTAHEAMALGKAVLCFIRHRADYLLDPESCPIVDVTPETLQATIRELAGDRPRLRRLGEAGRRYIEAHHTPEHFARRLESALGEVS